MLYQFVAVSNFISVICEPMENENPFSKKCQSSHEQIQMAYKLHQRTEYIWIIGISVLLSIFYMNNALGLSEVSTAICWVYKQLILSYGFYRCTDVGNCTWHWVLVIRALQDPAGNRSNTAGHVGATLKNHFQWHFKFAPKYIRNVDLLISLFLDINPQQIMKGWIIYTHTDRLTDQTNINKQYNNICY